MNRYKLIFSYCGTPFNGYAKQIDTKTIQGEIEDKLSLILNEAIILQASGRTDKGVHAINQVAHFDTTKEIESLEKLKYSLNKLIDPNIRFKNIEKVDESFHSRFSAKGKIYQYVINLKEYLPFFKDLELYISDLDIEKMEKASKLFVGKHNFMNFTSKKEDDDNFIRDIFSIKFEDKKDRIYIYFYGNGFMRYEIRKIVGTLIEIGKGKIDESYIKEHLNSSTRNIVTYQAPAKALYLKEVIY